MKISTLLVGSLLALLTAANASAQPSPKTYKPKDGVAQTGAGQKFAVGTSEVLPLRMRVGEMKTEDATKVPATVDNLETLVTDAGSTVTLTWDAPTTDVSGGELDTSALTYAVYRSADGKNFTMLASDIKDATTYTDTTVKALLDEIGLQQENIYYAVAAVNTEGSGEAIARPAVVGTPYGLPFKESFAGGYVSNNPWTVSSLVGTMGWVCLANDSEAGMYPQDSDDGFIKFYSPFYENETDSRILSPLISLKGTKDPSVTLFMFHWADSDIPDDGKNTKLTVEVTTDSKTFTQVGEPLMSTAATAGWQEHRISLADYKDCDQLRIVLRGSMDNYWMYYYVDNVRVEDTPARDLSAMSLSGPSTLNTDKESVYTLDYSNRGTETMSGYTVSLYMNDRKVASVEGEDIAPGETKSAYLYYTPTAHDAGLAGKLYAMIEADDEYADNNTSYNTIGVSVKGTWYPKAENLHADADGDKVTLSWSAPEIPTEPVVTEDGVEDYQPFIINNIGDWTVYDMDGLAAGSPYDFPYFDNKNTEQAFQVWNPYELSKELTADDAWLLPRTGKQCFICWYAMVSYDGVAQANDDWLISPELCGNTTFSFYMRRLRTSTDEKFQILSSSTDTDPSSFTLVEEGIATEDWTRYDIPVGADTRYIAVRYLGCDQYGLMIDDISYTSALYDLKVAGYNVFRDGVKMNDEPLTSPEFTDYDVESGKTYSYSVSVVYNRGESDDTDEIQVECTTGIDAADAADSKVYASDGRIVVDNAGQTTVAVYGVDGALVATSKTSGRCEIKVARGVYLVKVGGKTTKIFVR